MKVTVIVLQSLDGYIAKSHEDDLSWATIEDRKFFKSKSIEIGTMLMGSTTFNNMKGIKGTAFKDRQVLVFTSSPEKYSDYRNDFAKVEFFNGTPEESIRMLEKQGKKEVAVVGGGSLIRQFIENNLVDEIYVTIAPYIFGNGVKVCDKFIENESMTLIDFEKLSENEILLHYKVNKLN